MPNNDVLGRKNLGEHILGGGIDGSGGSGHGCIVPSWGVSSRLHIEISKENLFRLILHQVELALFKVFADFKHDHLFHFVGSDGWGPILLWISHDPKD